MNMTFSCWLLFGLLLLLGSVPVHAEGECPPGMFPTNPPGAQGPVGCAPIPGYDPQRAQPQAPPPIWEPRWGAIATDGPGGSFGASTDMPNQQSAENIALADCRAKKGSTTCSIDLSYGNGCAAMVVGDTEHNSRAGLTADLATQAAMKVCNELDAHCFVYYTGCSLPQRVQ